jgi:DNA helicase-2/ATP-dependent DNA helicase PcrA
VARELGLHNGRGWRGVTKEEVAACFRAYYERGEVPSEPGPCLDLFTAFIRRCEENNSMTFGALILGLRLLTTCVQPSWLGWRHILVDEAQDLDPVQWTLVKELAQVCNATLFVVGDVSQCIYQWRGAVPGYLVEMERLFATYRLESNYRSDPRIVDAANILIEKNALRLPLTMRSERAKADSDGATVCRGMDSRALAEWLTKYMGDKPVAVLSRLHNLLAKLSEDLTARGIPHHYAGQTVALANSEPFRRLHAFLKLRVNPHDNFAFLLVKDVLGIPDEEYGAIRVRAAEQGQSHFEAWQTWFLGAPEARAFFAPDAPLDLERRRIGFALDDLRLRLTGGHDSDLGGLQPAWDFARAWADKRSPRSTIADYLSWLATYEVQDEMAGMEEQAPITLCTIHAAKGLEWPVVVVAGMNETILPSKQSVAAGPEEIEAERRLAYVAATRARDALVLAVRPEERVVEVKGQKRAFFTPVSRFVGEMGL